MCVRYTKFGMSSRETEVGKSEVLKGHAHCCVCYLHSGFRISAQDDNVKRKRVEGKTPPAREGRREGRARKWLQCTSGFDIALPISLESSQSACFRRPANMKASLYITGGEGLWLPA